MKDVDVSVNARELRVAFSVTVVTIFCTLSPLILKVVLGGPFIVLNKNEVTGTGPHRINLERKVKSGSPGSTCIFSHLPYSWRETATCWPSIFLCSQSSHSRHYKDYLTLTDRWQMRREDLKGGVAHSKLICICCFSQLKLKALFSLTSWEIK